MHTTSVVGDKLLKTWPTPVASAPPPKIAGAGADRGFGIRAACQTGHNDLGPSSLEASDRVCGLKFDDDFASQHVAKSGTSELGRVAKH